MKPASSFETSKRGKANNDHTIRFFTDGSGARLDGEGSGFAWLREDTGESHAELVRALTNNQAECHSVLSALKSVARCSKVEISNDSQVVVGLLSGQFAVRDANLADLVGMIQTVIGENQLSVAFRWIPRQQNRADKILQRAKGAARLVTTKKEI